VPIKHLLDVNGGLERGAIDCVNRVLGVVQGKIYLYKESQSLRTIHINVFSLVNEMELVKYLVYFCLMFKRKVPVLWRHLVA